MHAYSKSEEAAVGRGAYRSSQNASAIVMRLRGELASWINASADEISLHAGGTEALNTAIFGMLKPGDHVVTTAAEHNSVLRPLQFLVDQGMIQQTIVDVSKYGRCQPSQIKQAITDQTRLVAIVHAANVNGAVQEISEIAKEIAQPDSQRPLLLCDAAQSFGHLTIDVQHEGIDLLAAPGHKGGCGPLGTGFLYVRKECQGLLRPFLFGGTGTASEQVRMPNEFPSSFEAGNMNVPALAGWLAGLRNCRAEKSPAEALRIAQAEMKSLAEKLYGMLESIDGICVIGKPETLRLPVVSLSVEGIPASEAAMILDSEFGIEVRSGLHCAALIHQAIGSPQDGTLRISCGQPTTDEDLESLGAALKELTS